MTTQDNQPKIMENENAQVKKYQAPIFNEFGSLVDLTAGGVGGEEDGNFTGTRPL